MCVMCTLSWGQGIVVCAEPHGSFICGWDSCLQSEDNGLYLTPDTERAADICRIYQDRELICNPVFNGEPVYEK